MKRILSLLIGLTLTLSAFPKLKVVEGSTTFLKQSPNVIEIKWDFSNTGYDTFTDVPHLLENPSTKKMWEENLFEIRNGFISGLRDKASGDNHSYTEDYSDSKYQMLVTPQFIGSDGNIQLIVTIKEREGDQNVVLFYEAKDPFSGNMRAYLSLAFKKAGKAIRNCISIETTSNKVYMTNTQVSYGDTFLNGYNMKIKVTTENDSAFLIISYTDNYLKLSDTPKLLIKLMDGNVISLDGKLLANHSKSDVGIMINSVYVESNYFVSEAKFPINKNQILQFEKGIKKLRLNTSPRYHEKEWKRDKIGKVLFNYYLRSSSNSFEDGF